MCVCSVILYINFLLPGFGTMISACCAEQEEPLDFGDDINVFDDADADDETDSDLDAEAKPKIRPVIDMKKVKVFSKGTAIFMGLL